MNEAETRAELIDPALRAAGWGVVEGSRVRREVIAPGRLHGAGQRGRAEIADYVLIYRNHKLAVIEAKKRDTPASEGVAQAKAYAAKLAVRFTYATNGVGIYGIDMQTGAEGDVDRFPTPDELWNHTFAVENVWRNRFAAVPFEDKGGTWSSRYYQEIAINNVLEAVTAGRERILLTLATGTGKTAIAFQIAWKLYHSRWNLTRDAADVSARRPRILFLADRNILADQAYNAFSAFEDSIPGSLVRISPEEIRKRGKVPKNGSVFFTIFQTFMSGSVADPVRPELVEGPPGKSEGLRQAQPERVEVVSQREKGNYFGDYPPDFFDFIIIDECHRGGAADESNWRGILDYFASAVQLGLTATPKRTDNVDTYAYFGEPVYVYSLKEGINDGFLTPFKVKQIATTLDEYVFTPDDLVLEGDIEAGRRYTEDDFNRIIEIMAREEYRVKIFMNLIDQREKTLVFCATQEHAAAVRDLVNQMKTSKYPDYCVRVTANDGARGDQLLREFQDNEKSIPTILTTSQKLSTGVDARNVRNIVLMRPVGSMIEFKQIIGRGTRLYEGKDYFTIIDFVKAHHHFQDPEWDGEPISPETGNNYAPRQTNEPPAVRSDEEDSVPAIIPKRVKIKLRDGKERAIQHMMATTFMSGDGSMMSAAQFLESLFGTLPEFFKDEDQLRAIWSAPDTRKQFLSGLSDKGFGHDQLLEMQKIIEAENSDLFDVLAFVAFALTPVPRAARRACARTSASIVR